MELRPRPGFVGQRTVRPGYLIVVDDASPALVAGQRDADRPIRIIGDEG